MSKLYSEGKGQSDTFWKWNVFNAFLPLLFKNIVLVLCYFHVILFMYLFIYL